MPAYKSTFTLTNNTKRKNLKFSRTLPANFYVGFDFPFNVGDVYISNVDSSSFQINLENNFGSNVIFFVYIWE